ncbi:hypothetical protein NSQ76_10935 [Bacillus sp. FSL M8-0256]|uniref:hypothetical protein n=1 Tax=Bacillus sp. FSL M8-0256 TaxID=2954578 RepID=UPI0030F9F61D
MTAGLSSADFGVTIYDELFCDDEEIPIQFTGGLTKMNIDPRQAFRAFMKYQLENGEAVAELGLKKEDIEKFILNAEDDMFFYDKLDEFLKDFIEIYGENYGIEL